MTTPPPSPPRSHWTRRVLLPAGILLVAYGAASFAFSALVNAWGGVAGVQARLEAVLGAPVELEAARVGLLPPSLRLKDLATSDPLGLGARRLRARTAVLPLAVLPLLRGDIRITRWEFREISLEGAEGAGDAAGRGLLLDRLVAWSPSEAGDEEGATLALRGHGELRAGSPPLLLRGPVELALGLLWEEEAGRLLIRTGDVRVGRVPLQVTGQVEELGHPIREVALEVWGANLPLGDVMAVIQPFGWEPGRLGGQGPVSLTFRLAGQTGWGLAPRLTGHVGLAGGTLLLGDTVLGEQIGADLALTPDLELEGAVRGSLLGGPVDLDGRLALGPGGPAVDLNLRAAPTLESLTSLRALPRDMTGNGALGAVLRIQGPLVDPLGLRVEGALHPLELTLASPAWSGPLRVPGGTLGVEGGRVVVDSLAVVVGGESLTATGEIPNLLAILFSDSVPRFRGTVRAPSP